MSRNAFFAFFRTRTWKIISWIPVAAMVPLHCGTISRVSGRSMQPTLNPEPCIQRDVSLFDRFSFHILKLRAERGDVVSFRSPVNPTEYLVKRVVAVEGDTVRTLPPYPLPEVKVPEGHVWVEGDEQFWTTDSNSWGPIPMNIIDARLVYILWPLNRFGKLKEWDTRNVQAVRAASRSGPAWKRELAELEREKWTRKDAPCL